MKTKVILGIALLATLLLSSGCTKQIEKPVQSDQIEGAPEIPKNLQTVVGEGEVTLSWSVSDQTKLLRFLIYRGDTTRTGPNLLDSTSELSYVDRNLRNGLRYIYQVSAVGRNLLEGKLSDPVSAIPNTYSISIAEGARYTNTVNVNVNMIAPASTRMLMLGNDSLFSGSSWSIFSSSKTWKLESGEGVRYVYARFRDQEGNVTSRFVYDDIIVDTRARIAAVVESSNGRILTAGSTVRFILTSGEDEGIATVDVGSLGTINLYQDVITIDTLTGPGVYAVDYVIPGGIDVINAAVTGNFTDAAGNRAQARAAATFINVANPPPAVTLTNYVVSETEVELSWTRSTAEDFASYLLFRSGSNRVDSTSMLMQTQTSIATTTFRDTGLDDSTDYYYAIYTVDKSGLMSKSNVLKVMTVANPPAPVALSAYIVSESEIELDWTKSTASDFASYLLFRSDSATVSTASTLLQTQTSSTTTTFRDLDRKPATDYYYAVFTVDKSGLMSKSNVVRATTLENQAPKSVSLFVTKQDSTSITLGWTKNNDKDFDSYRIYRSATSPVGQGTGNITGVVASQGTTEYTDRNITKGQKFYYIVVVLDKYGAASTASNEVLGPNP